MVVHSNLNFEIEEYDTQQEIDALENSLLIGAEAVKYIYQQCI